MVRVAVAVTALLMTGCATFAVAPPARVALGGPLESGTPFSGQAGAAGSLAPFGGVAGELNTVLRVSPALAADASLETVVGTAGSPTTIFVGSLGARFTPPLDGPLRTELSGHVSLGCGGITNEAARLPAGCPHHLSNGFGLGGALGLRFLPWFLFYVTGRYQLITSSTLPWTDWGQFAGGCRLDDKHLFASLDAGVLALRAGSRENTGYFATLLVGAKWP